MSGRCVLIDCGNSALKWAVLGAAGLGPVSYLRHDGDPAAAAAGVGCDLGAPPDSVLLASVAAPAATARLAAVLGERCQRAPEVLRSEAAAFGLRSGYANPAQLGVDRWLAMVAAWSLLHGPCCVVDCGTAATVDAIAGNGRHLGGYILPGIGSARRALLTQTHIPRVDEGDAVDDHQPFGTDTAAAVALGARYAIVGAIDHAMRELEQRGERPVLLLAGSEADRIAPRLEHDFVRAPHLVLEGMARYAAARSRACAG